MRRILVASVALLLVAGAPGGARASEPEAYGVVRGTVTNADGIPVADVCVQFHEFYVDEDTGETYLDEWSWQFGHTGPDGTYAAEVWYGRFLVQFRDCSEDPSLLPQWYDHVDDSQAATVVEVDPGSEITGIDAALRLGGAIEGIVTNENGDPLRNMCVRVNSDEPHDHWDEDGDAFYDYTDSNGRYRVGSLATGDYVVGFGCEEPVYYDAWPPVYEPRVAAAAVTGPAVSPDDPQAYVREWFDDAARFADATRVHVDEGHEVTGVSAAMTLGGAIAGKVTDEQGAVAPWACVTAFSTSGDWITSTYADDHGLYVLLGLRSGSYKVSFEGCSRQPLSSEWYFEAGDFRTATPVEVVAPEVTGGIDATLAHYTFPDPAVNDVTIENVPLRTDVASVPVGWNRKVHVTVANVGTETTYWPGRLLVRVRTPGDDRVTSLGSRSVGRLEPGASKTLTFDWNGVGYLGDAKITAQLCGSYWEWDQNSSNNRRTADGYVGVGGTGWGNSRLAQADGFESCYYDPYY